MRGSVRAEVFARIERDAAFRQQMAAKLAAGREETPNGCWEWRGARAPNGYGVLSTYASVGAARKSVVLTAHRVACALAHGPIGERHVLHSCDNRACVRPDHLSPGTHSDNMQDMVRKGRHGIARMLNSGERNNVVKHTADEARTVAALVRSGQTNRQIADHTGLDLNFVSNVSSGRAWYHVSGLPRRVQVKRSANPVRRATIGARRRWLIVGALAMNGPQTAAAIAKTAGEDAQAIGAVCARLENDGWLLRHSAPADGLAIVWAIRPR